MKLRLESQDSQSPSVAHRGCAQGVPDAYVGNRVSRCKGGASDVLRIAKHALETSPFTPWETGDLADPPRDELLVNSLDGHTATIGKAAAEDGGVIAGTQHHWIEDGQREWNAEVVAYELNGNTLAAVRVECNLLSPGPPIPTTKKPYVVKKLIRELGGADDAGLRVVDHPHRLSESDVDLAVEIVRGNFAGRLPVVYVSVGRSRRPYIDTDELAGWLAGMAHVVVEPSRYFAFALARNTGHLNAYGGAVSIYWPQGASTQARFLPSAYPQPAAMQRDVAVRVTTALTQIRQTSNCTVEYLHGVVSRRRFEALKSHGYAGIEQYVEAFDAEIHAKDEQVSSLEREVQRLRAELRRNDYADQRESGILTRGKEREFYPGELKDAVLHTLSSGRNSLLEDGRRAHLVSDLLECNSSTDTEEEYDEEIKDAFSESGDLDGDKRRALEDLGFSVESGGKHWKVVYQNDDRYTFTVSKTSSDHRAGKNMASTILKKLFK